MLVKLFFVLVSMSSFPIMAQDEVVSIGRATQLVREKSYTDSVRVFQKAFALKEGNYRQYYDAACAAALAGQSELAITWLNRTIDLNWTNIDHMKTDTDLDSLHIHPQWQAILARLQAKLDVLELSYDQPLKQELEAIFKEDQELRQSLSTIEKKYGSQSKEMKVAWRDIEKKDAKNLKRVKEILDSKGWLGPDQVGARASTTLWLVIQHANTKEWKKYLPGLRQAVLDKKARPENLALLEDRYLAFGLHKKQLYGSQLQSINGVTKLMPIEDPDHLDERRAAMGLPPIAEYLQNWNLTWDLEAYKKSLLESDTKAKKK